MSAKKYKPYGICGFCLNELETLDADISKARHIHTQLPWKQCEEAVMGRNLLQEAIGASLRLGRPESQEEARKRLRNRLERNGG